MPLTIGWQDVALRLAVTIVAGLAIGFNRGEHGRPAGMRTTLLVCLAASFAMLLANLLLTMRGRSVDSFVQLDVMRLPLGILSGMGFIGAGTILRKGSLIVGVTTAATLWFVTVMGLCIGAGEIALGLTAMALGLVTLSGLTRVEAHLLQDRSGTLRLAIEGTSPSEARIREQIAESGCRVLSWGSLLQRDPLRRTICCEVGWRASHDNTDPPKIVAQFEAEAGVTSVSWQTQTADHEAAA